MFRLQSVQNRPGIRAPLAEKFVEIFNWYEADLEEVHQIYESHKVSTVRSLSLGHPLIKAPLQRPLNNVKIVQLLRPCIRIWPQTVIFNVHVIVFHQ